MNIFFLSPDPTECAIMHNDKHVIKMILEYAQLLSTAHHVLDGDKSISSIYKPTHVSHPSAIWVRESRAHYTWLWRLLVALCKEYSFRYHKTHKVESSGLMAALESCPKNLKEITWKNPPPKVMPDEFKHSSTIESYRNYYTVAKKSFSTWRYRKPPTWFNT